MALISGERDQDRFLLHTIQRGARISLSLALSLELPTEYSGVARLRTEVRICATVCKSRKRSYVLPANMQSAQLGVNRVLAGRVTECDMPVLSFTLNCGRNRAE